MKQFQGAFLIKKGANIQYKEFRKALKGSFKKWRNAQDLEGQLSASFRGMRVQCFWGCKFIQTESPRKWRVPEVVERCVKWTIRVHGEKQYNNRDWDMEMDTQIN